ncbi:hypothetical protein [Arcanobacterium phocae]|uniref:hypothetical protein n=1 Tax=Arcanobacterium phocae TaxID=131112 RepID=UPI001C1150F1|nr:hypothetical protein [Arcanobacterium phocae]
MTGKDHREIRAGQCPKDVWALDLQFDSTWHGKMIKICHIIDEYTREHVTFAIDRRLDVASVIELLDPVSLEHGAGCG